MHEHAIFKTIQRFRGLGLGPRTLIRVASVLMILVLPASQFSQGQEKVFLQAQPAMFLSANDQFGFELLKATSEEFGNQNVVISPLPVSLAFAALRDGGVDDESFRQIVRTLHWVKGAADQTRYQPYVPLAAGMVLRRFEKPKPRPLPAKIPVGMPRAALHTLLSGNPEEVWLSVAFLYRTAGALSRDFVNRVTEDTGIPFRIVGDKTSQPAALTTSWDRTAPMPRISGHRDFWITSSTHLRTSWAGNTFVASKREKRNFHLQPTTDVSVDFLTTELEGYLHARTDQFEAVELPCKQATILLVLPPADTGIEHMEATIMLQPNLVESQLTRDVGDVTLPPFHFVFEADLRSRIEKLGVHRVFTDLQSLQPMAPSTGGVLRGVVQKTEITLDENGIRADSGTIVSGVLGGLAAGPPEPFHMVLDRPFLFFVRDNVTRALIFEGVVLNPALE